MSAFYQLSFLDTTKPVTVTHNATELDHIRAPTQINARDGGRYRVCPWRNFFTRLFRRLVSNSSRNSCKFYSDSTGSWIKLFVKIYRAQQQKHQKFKKSFVSDNSLAKHQEVENNTRRLWLEQRSCFIWTVIQILWQDIIEQKNIVRTQKAADDFLQLAANRFIVMWIIT
jgi:hypothetical protein